MPSGLTNSSQPGVTSTDTGDVIGFGDYIDRQLTKVRTFVRLSDLAVAITTCTAVVCVLLFVLILVDHWLFDLGRVGRAAALTALLSIVGYFSFAWILPLIVKRINPAYVAHVIEQGEPSLKNGLLNFVLFRSKPQSVRKVILEAVERRAAVDLSRINVDTAIDRTPLIRIGAALGALLVGLALYAMISPKDPLATIARVLSPWSDRARPSRVQILDVEPGSTTVYAGHQLAVNAKIENLAESDRAVIVYSTPDGQVVDARFEMRADGDGRWSARLPETNDGLQQDVTYQISAGDAVAGPYRVNVLPSPSIVVDRLEYDYPDYTLRDAMVVEQAGDINALEGTRVTVNASANQDIDYAYVEFDAMDAVVGTDDDNAANPRQTLTMKHEGRKAWTSFTLRLQPDRGTPWHRNYQVRFRNLDGATNDRPIRYDIHVTPDIPPVVEILTPSKRQLDVPFDATQSIEIRAVDPDYGLTGIVLRAANGNRPLLDDNLLNHDQQNDQATAAFTGQQVVTYAFAPRKLGLRPGDDVVYWARASDNRIEPGTSTAAPNVTKTQEYRFHITEAQNSRGKSSETDDTASSENTDEREKNDGGGDSDRGEPNDSDSKSGGANQGDPDQGANSDQTDPDKRDDSPAGGDDEQGSSEGAENDGKQGEQGNARDNNDGAQDQNAGQAEENDNHGGQAGKRQDADGARDQTNDGGQPSGNDGKNGANADGRDERETDAANNTSDENQSSKASGNTDEQTNENRSDQTDGQQSNATDNQQDGQTERQNRGAKSSQSDSEDELQSDDDSEPLPSDGSRDGDAMERILKEIRKRTGKKPEDATHKPCDNCTDGSCENCRNAAQGEPSGEKSGSGSSSNKNGSSANKRSDSPRESDEAAKRTGDSQQKETSQDPTSEKNDPRNTDSQNAGESDGPGDDAEEDSPPQGTSGQPNSDDVSDAAEPNDTESETDRQPTSNNDTSPGPTESSDSDKQGAGPSVEPNESSQTGGQDNSADPNGTSGSSGQGATAPDGGSSPPAADDTASTDVDEADEANLDYARQATDLVLEYLKDQKNQRDGDLLDKLGWSPEDLEKFRQRWEQMKRDAGRNDPVGVSAQRELDEVLRSLGLTPTRDRLQAARSRNDSIQVRNTGRRSKPPASYRERYERFLKSISNQDSSP